MVDTFKKLFIIVIFPIWIISYGTANAVSTTSFSELATQEVLGKAEEAVGRKIGNYTLTDQFGTKFQLNTILDKPLIISFIYTTCDYACPMISVHLSDVAKEAGSDFGKKFRIVTVSFDPEDTSEKMKAYGANYTDDFKNWIFATGDKENISNLAKDIGLSYMKTGSAYQHLDLVTIIDAKGAVYKQVYGIDFKPKTVLKYINMAAEQKQLWVYFANIFDAIKSICYSYDVNTGRYVANFAMLIIIIFGIAVQVAIAFLLIYIFRISRKAEHKKV